MILAAMVLLSASAFAQDGKSIYRKYSESKGVSAVYISPAMFRMMGRIPEMDLGEKDVNVTSAVKQLSGFYLLNSENPSINDNIRRDAERFVDSGRYELLMEVKDEGEVVRIFTCGDDEIITSFVFIASESDECTFICMDGRISREQIERLLAQ